MAFLQGHSFRAERAASPAAPVRMTPKFWYNDARLPKSDYLLLFSIENRNINLYLIAIFVTIE